MPNFGDRGAPASASAAIAAASSAKLSDNSSQVNCWRAIGEIVAELILRCAENSGAFGPAVRQAHPGDLD
jgi:hypothetical protein